MLFDDLKKLHRTIRSCRTEQHFIVARKMSTNFVRMHIDNPAINPHTTRHSIEESFRLAREVLVEDTYGVDEVKHDAPEMSEYNYEGGIPFARVEIEPEVAKSGDTDFIPDKFAR